MALFIGIMNEEIVIEMNFIIVLIGFLKYSKLKKCVKNTQNEQQVNSDLFLCELFQG